MDSQQSKSKTKLFVVIGSLVVVLIVAGAAYAIYLTATMEPQEQTQQNSSETQSDEVTVTEQSLKQDLTDISTSVDEQKATHEAAKKIVNETQVKVAK